MKLSGLNAIITGASQGLGLEIARAFVRDGASVALCARDAAKLDAAARELRALATAGQKIVALPCDVSDPTAVSAFAAAAIAGLGSVQVLVNNAGIYGPKGPTESVDFAAWKHALEINLFGVLLPCRELIPHFKAQGRGKIINLSGGGATAPMPFISAYAASKAAVVRLTETLAEELRADKIDVNAVAPGFIKTDMTADFVNKPDLAAKILEVVPLKRLGEAADIANMCNYLCSEEAGYITGQVFTVDGGMAM